MTYSSQYQVTRSRFHPGLTGPFDTVSGTASYAVGEAGGITSALLPMLGVTGPAGAIVGIGAGIIAQVVSMFHGCGQSCTLTSEAADQIESGLKQMLNAYMSGGHTKNEQTAYLQQFDALWAKLMQYCGSGSFGKAGVNCVQDRQAGACKWKSSAYGWQGTTYVPSGPAGSGEQCWNWFAGYRDPVAKDPTVVPDAVVAGASGTSNAGVFGGGSGTGPQNLAPLLIVAALVVAGALL